VSRLPGVEFLNKQTLSNKIIFRENPVGGFLGITEKGPLHSPRLITSYQQYQELYGSMNCAGYLPFCVYSFFQNGGRQCYVVRTAHTEGEGRAFSASLVINDAGGSPFFRLTAQSEGTWGNDLCINFWHSTNLDEEIRIHLCLNYAEGQEDFLDMSLNPRDEDFFINHINRRSSLVKALPGVDDIKNVTPDEIINSWFSGGRDGLANLSPGDFIGTDKGPGRKTGLAVFESLPDVNLIATPDTAFFFDRSGTDIKKAEKEVKAVHTALIAQAEKIEGRFALLDLGAALNPQEAAAYRDILDSSCAALYYPEVSVLDPLRDEVFAMPCSCAIAGIISKLDIKNGCYYPPGNRFIYGAVGQNRPVDSAMAAWLYEKGINSLRKIPGRGVTVWGVKTVSSDPLMQYINVRRTVSFLSSAMKRGTAWAVFEPNDSALQKRVIRHITAFLIDVWRKGYLAGKTPSEAFYIKCDSELNPPENIDAGILTVQVGLCVVKPSEYISVTLQAEKENTNVILGD